MEVLKHECGVAMVRLLKPLEYYQNNLDSTLILLSVMREFKVKKIIFSRSMEPGCMGSISSIC